jgi:acyl-CoA thioester hydrolase
LVREVTVPFRFFQPIEVRYSDIDAQRHVNSARYFTYMEQARAAYLQALGLWAGDDFEAIGIIIADQSCSYKQPIRFGQRIEVGVRTADIGTKSLQMEYLMRDSEDQRELARGRTVLVAYDYLAGMSIAVPEGWKRRIKAFEAGEG